MIHCLALPSWMTTGEGSRAYPSAMGWKIMVLRFQLMNLMECVPVVALIALLIFVQNWKRFRSVISSCSEERLPVLETEVLFADQRGGTPRAPVVVAAHLIVERTFMGRFLFRYPSLNRMGIHSG